MNKSTRVALLLGLVLLLPTSLGTMARPMEAVPGLPAVAADVDPLGEISDAELVYRLARVAGHDVSRPVLPAAPSAAELPALVMRLGERAGAPVTVEDAMAFAELDPSIAVPIAHMMVAMDQAWTLRDQAIAGLTEEEKRELTQLFVEGRVDDPRYLELSSQVDPVPLVEGAIVVLDTLESIVLPQLVALEDAPVWPADAVADPVGVLRIGGTGTDVERMNRILQIDARGDDEYYNNAGGTTLLDDLDPTTHDVPVALSIDLSGNDYYERTWENMAQGGAFLGFGSLYELAGDDAYHCARICQGGAGLGIALLREYAGHDTYVGGGYGKGGGEIIAILRDDDGNDLYHLPGSSAGYGFRPESTGLLWDRAGQDYYATHIWANHRLGWGEEGGRGWFVDDGPELDVYETADDWDPAYAHGCNNCTWTIGSGIAGRSEHGHGVDNHGGLGHLLSQYEHI